jgi:hypothetical protein
MFAPKRTSTPAAENAESIGEKMVKKLFPTEKEKKKRKRE